MGTCVRYCRGSGGTSKGMRTCGRYCRGSGGTSKGMGTCGRYCRGSGGTSKGMGTCGRYCRGSGGTSKGMETCGRYCPLYIFIFQSNQELFVNLLQACSELLESPVLQDKEYEEYRRQVDKCIHLMRNIGKHQ